jgi:hypothetical protein
VLYKTVLTLNCQGGGEANTPHRSKVKGKINANLLKIMVRTPSCAYGISWKCNIAATPDHHSKSKTSFGTSEGLAWVSC